MGFSESGLPLGLQIAGRPYDVELSNTFSLETGASSPTDHESASRRGRNR